MKKTEDRVIYMEKSADMTTAMRIVEKFDENPLIEWLKGDVFKPEYNPDVSPQKLAKEESEFESRIEEEGTFGYVLEKWDIRPDEGWIQIDSIWGFVGRYSEGEGQEHYIVNEMKDRIKKEFKGNQKVS